MLSNTNPTACDFNMTASRRGRRVLPGCSSQLTESESTAAEAKAPSENLSPGGQQVIDPARVHASPLLRHLAERRLKPSGPGAWRTQSDPAGGRKSSSHPCTSTSWQNTNRTRHRTDAVVLNWSTIWRPVFQQGLKKKTKKKATRSLCIP